MRHNASGRKLGRKTGHRLAMFRNQLASLVASERIVTTISKAKELRPLVEKMVTQGRRDTVHARRLVGRWIQSRDLVRKLFEEIAPRFATRPGGYLRIVKLGSRQGDGAEMAVLEFVDFQLKKKTKAPPPPAADGKKGKKAAAGAPETAAVEAAVTPAKEAKARPAGKKARPAKQSAGKAEPKGPTGKAGKKTPSTVKRSSGPKKTGGS